MDYPKLSLSHTTIEEHCTALLKEKTLPFWWYQGAHKLMGNYSLPFRDNVGNWWYQVKPGLAWPVNFFSRMKPGSFKLPLRKSYLGLQYLVDNGKSSNSRLHINSILSLKKYGPQSVDSKRRTKIRAGLRQCELGIMNEYDQETIHGCYEVWNDLNSRTGWKGAITKKWFEETWRSYIGIPGNSIIIAREKESGQVAGFHMLKILGDTAYGDAVASHSTYLKCRVNDAMIYTFLKSAGELLHVEKAHYGIKSYVTNLESFKRSMGFVADGFPARTALNPIAKAALGILYPSAYRRMVGKFE